MYTPYHHVRVDKLIKLLQKLPPTHMVVPNDLQNLCVINGDNEYIGVIDLGTEELDLFR